MGQRRRIPTSGLVAIGVVIGAAAGAVVSRGRTAPRPRDAESDEAMVSRTIVENSSSDGLEAPEQPCNDPQLTDGRPRYGNLIASSIALVLLVAGIVVSYRYFVDASAYPSPRAEPGTAYLFFDRPGVPALFQSTIRAAEFGETNIQYLIQVDAEYKGTSVGYSLVLMGDATTVETYPSGEPSAGKSGCWASMWAVPEDALACRVAAVSPDRLWSAMPDQGERAQIISGTITRTAPGAMWVDIATRTSVQYVEQAGKRRYFALPGLGTSYLPKVYRDRLTVDLRDGHSQYAPIKLDVAIDFGELNQSDRIESVAPEPLAGSLTWVEVDTYRLYTRGSIIDTVLEEGAQRSLFLIGLYVGIAGAILPVLAPTIWRNLRRRRQPIHVAIAAAVRQRRLRRG